MEYLSQTVGSLAGAERSIRAPGRLQERRRHYLVDGLCQIRQPQPIGGKITKDGTGTLTLTGSNLYTGVTTITAGTILANNTSGSGTGTGAITIAAPGRWAEPAPLAGQSPTTARSPPEWRCLGTLHASRNVTNAANSHWAIELSGTSSDKLAVGGNLDLSAVDVLDITGSGTGPWIIATIPVAHRHIRYGHIGLLGGLWNRRAARSH